VSGHQPFTMLSSAFMLQMDSAGTDTLMDLLPTVVGLIVIARILMSSQIVHAGAWGASLVEHIHS
jgi:hypothetical protein